MDEDFAILVIDNLVELVRHGFICSLSPCPRAYFVLKVHYNFSTDDLVKVLKCSRKNINLNLCRARQDMAKNVERQYDNVCHRAYPGFYDLIVTAILYSPEFQDFNVVQNVRQNADGKWRLRGAVKKILAMDEEDENNHRELVLATISALLPEEKG